jgi:hypothetical protein
LTNAPRNPYHMHQAISIHDTGQKGEDLCDDEANQIGTLIESVSDCM